jgi:hypothetical protein
LRPRFVAAKRPIKSAPIDGDLELLDIGQERLVVERRRESLAQKREPFRRGARRRTDDQARKSAEG